MTVREAKVTARQLQMGGYDEVYDTLQLPQVDDLQVMQMEAPPTTTLSKAQTELGTNDDFRSGVEGGGRSREGTWRLQPTQGPSQSNLSHQDQGRNMRPDQREDCRSQEIGRAHV